MFQDARKSELALKQIKCIFQKLQEMSKKKQATPYEKVTRELLVYIKDIVR